MENRMTITNLYWVNKIVGPGHNETICTFDRNNGVWKRLEHCIALCSNTEFGKDQEGVHVLKEEVNGHTCEAALDDLIDGNVSDYKEKIQRVFKIPYSEVNNFDGSIHLNDSDPNRRPWNQVTMKGEPGRIMECCEHIYKESMGDLHDGLSQVPLSKEWKESINWVYTDLKLSGDLVLGFCELNLDFRSYPQGYEFDFDKMNFPLKGAIFAGLVSLTEGSNTIENENGKTQPGRTIDTENQRTVTHVWFGSKVEDISENQSGSTFDKCNRGWKMLERCISLCSNAVFREEWQDTIINGTIVKGIAIKGGVSILEKTDTSSMLDYAAGNTWNIRYVEWETSSRNLMDYIRAKNKKVCEINKYKQKSEFDVSIHYTPDNRYLLVMMGDPERILKHCSTLVIDGKEVPLSEEWENVFNQAYMELKGQEGHIFGCCELMLDEKKYSQGYAFDPDEIDTYIGGEGHCKFVGLVSIIEESNIEKEKETLCVIEACYG